VLVIGVDPGLATTGYGLVRETEGRLETVAYGVVTTLPKHTLPQRLQQLHRELLAIVELHQPDEGAIEELFFSRNVRTAMTVGQARGVALLAMADADLPVTDYTPLTVKQAVSGFGGADKAQMQATIKMLLQLESLPSPDDAADALAVAICHLHSARLNRILREGQ
jgi:crossover junction endodeoxyribonuclease RuvC